MTGKTHLACGLGTTAALLAACGAVIEGHPLRLILGGEGVPAGGPRELSLEAWLGLLAWGGLAALWPDLDSVDSELLHLPIRMAHTAARTLSTVTRLRRKSPLILLFEGPMLAVAGVVTLLLRLFSWVIRQLTPHRGFTHTIWGLGLFTIVVGVLAGLLTGQAKMVAWATAVWAGGYLSHLLADAGTLWGIPFLHTNTIAWKDPDEIPSRPDQPSLSSPQERHRALYPQNFHLIGPRFQKLRVRTGTLPDVLLLRWGAWLILITSLVASAWG